MKNKEISLLMSHGRAYNSGSFLLKMLNISHILDVNVKQSLLKLKLSKKIAYIASKKTFNTAILRNKAKRRLKNSLKAAVLTIKNQNTEQIKLQNELFKENILIISAKKSILEVDFKVLTEEFVLILKKVL